MGKNAASSSAEGESRAKKRKTASSAAAAAASPSSWVDLRESRKKDEASRSPAASSAASAAASPSATSWFELADAAIAATQRVDGMAGIRVHLTRLTEVAKMRTEVLVKREKDVKWRLKWAKSSSGSLTCKSCSKEFDRGKRGVAGNFCELCGEVSCANCVYECCPGIIGTCCGVRCDVGSSFNCNGRGCGDCVGPSACGGCNRRDPDERYCQGCQASHMGRCK